MSCASCFTTKLQIGDAENPNADENKCCSKASSTSTPGHRGRVAVSERPKIDELRSYVFMVVHAVDFCAPPGFRTTELNLFIGKTFWSPTTTSPAQRQRTIEACKKCAIHRAGADRLTYHLLDALLENYQPALDELSSEIANMESCVLTARPLTFSAMSQLKSEYYAAAADYRAAGARCWRASPMASSRSSARTCCHTTATCWTTSSGSTNPTTIVTR
jgi:hypothetical protein